MPNLSTKTIQKLRLIQKAILAEPSLYDQGNYPDSALRHTCNTPCCISGWSVWVDVQDVKKYNRLLQIDRKFSIGTLMDRLDIRYDQAYKLFQAWPSDFSAAWFQPGTPESAIAGAARIDTFIESDGTI